MRRKLLIVIACILGVAATVTAEVSFNTGPLQLPHGYRLSLMESMLLIEHAGHPANSIPLNWILYGLALVMMLYCLIAIILGKDRSPRGFDVDRPEQP